MMQKMCQNLISCILSSENYTHNKNLHQIRVTNYLSSTVIQYRLRPRDDNHYRPTSSSLSIAVNCSVAMHSMSVKPRLQIA